MSKQRDETSRGSKWFGAKTSDKILGKSLHRTDRLVHRLLTLNFVSFLTKISTRQLLTIANSTGGKYGRYIDVTLLELFALRTHEFCLHFFTHTNLTAYSCCFNWVNTLLIWSFGFSKIARYCKTALKQCRNMG